MYSIFKGTICRTSIGAQVQIVFGERPIIEENENTNHSMMPQDEHDRLIKILNTTQEGLCPFQWYFNSLNSPNLPSSVRIPIWIDSLVRMWLLLIDLLTYTDSPEPLPQMSPNWDNQSPQLAGRGFQHRLDSDIHIRGTTDVVHRRNVSYEQYVY